MKINKIEVEVATLKSKTEKPSNLLNDHIEHTRSQIDNIRDEILQIFNKLHYEERLQKETGEKLHNLLARYETGEIKYVKNNN